MLAPGPRNLITDVPGLAVGNAEHAALLTGATVVLPDRPAVAAVDVRGGGPGTRETDLLALGRTVEEVHAIVLSGGSAFGLAAADGAMLRLRALGRGVSVGDALVPIVPAAILFDLAVAGDVDWSAPPWHALGGAAVDAAGPDFALGNAGAGRGATVGHGPGAIKGGLGSASVCADGITVGALAAVNPLGSVLMPGTEVFWTWWLEMAEELGGVARPAGAPATLQPMPAAPAPGNTTLVVVATDAQLDRSGAHRLAVMAQDGLARAIRPAHAPFDGDVVFALSTGQASAPDVPALSWLGALAADCTARAIMRAVVEAESTHGLPALRNGLTREP